MIEEIKEQLSDMQRLVYTHIEPDMYESHVKYLLSILESVEQDLSIIANSENVSSMNSIAEEALQAIRGGK